ncbi:ATP-dependent zinc metalloprotease FtsH [Candidatus Manganitrophus noduliformans]|uniref:ATP-dependent zinc metalloprotease FtsH n=1 Tax=Candidatus Manganitrophus noduliformans TaxID=2606439 RepID=A0A7X6ID73_9BACT|nr:ATP-dependent zinc metalloprotease FtsH [Candidatus Manganitrophus noduliformans]
MESKQQTFSFWYFIIAMIALLAVESYFVSPHAETLSYSEFKVLLKAGKVSNLTLGERDISGQFHSEGVQGLFPEERGKELEELEGSEHRFITTRVDDPSLIEELDRMKVQYAGKVETTWIVTLLSWIIPALLFFGLWAFFFRRMGAAGGMMEIGKSKAKVYMEKETKVTFDDVAGIDEAKAELMEVVEFLRSPEKYRRLGGKIPKGVLIVGAPGTGKTLLAKAVAGEAKVPFFSMSGSEFVEMFVGVGAARVRDLFAQAQEKAPCIIFIDELDALGKARGISPMISHDEREQTLNQLLVEMDGFDTAKGVIIMAATNRPEILDPALLRPGRFDRHVALDRPDLNGREKILNVHAKQITLAPEVDLRAIAAKVPGFVGADLANLVNEAALLAARKGKEAVETADFDEAIDRIVAGLEKKNRVMNAKEKETVAYHEAGHALIAECRPHADRVSKISIIPRGVAALGYTQQQPTEDRYLLKKTELLDRLDVLLGGRVAEEIIFGDISTGAQDDLQRATDLARHMVTRFGMSERLGLAAFASPAGNSFLRLPTFSEGREYSERTAQAIDEEIGRLLEEAHARVKETLVMQRGKLEALAKLLLEKEVIDRPTLEQALEIGEETVGAAVTEGRPSNEEGGNHHAAL